MRKPIIAVVSNKIVTNQNPFFGDVKSSVCIDYIQAVEKAGAVPLQIPLGITKEYFEYYASICSGFLFPGGPDIHPSLYGEPAHRNLDKVYLDFDSFQLTLLKQVLETGIPLLGICRGAQLLNIALGGTLYQDISETGTIQRHYMDADRAELAHPVKVERDTLLARLLDEELWVNSFHHQCIRRLGSGLRSAATSPDGIIEAIELIDHPFVVGIHPKASRKKATTRRCVLIPR